MYISAPSSSNVDKEFSCHVAISEGKDKTAANGCPRTAALSQGIEPKTDIMSLKVSSEQKYGEDKKQVDNSNICADKETCRKDRKDDKFPRLVDSSNFYNLVL